MKARSLNQVHYLGYLNPETLGEVEAEIKGIRTIIAHLKIREANMEMLALEMKYGKFDESAYEKQLREQREKELALLEKKEEEIKGKTEEVSSEENK